MTRDVEGGRPKDFHSCDQRKQTARTTRPFPILRHLHLPFIVLWAVYGTWQKGGRGLQRADDRVPSNHRAPTRRSCRLGTVREPRFPLLALHHQGRMTCDVPCNDAYNSHRLRSGGPLFAEADPTAFIRHADRFTREKPSRGARFRHALSAIDEYTEEDVFDGTGNGPRSANESNVCDLVACYTNGPRVTSSKQWVEQDNKRE